MPTSKVQTGLRLEEIMLKKITKIAKDQKRSLNAQLEFVVQVFLNEYESEHGEVIVDGE
jgi:hypothetical protein